MTRFYKKMYHTIELILLVKDRRSRRDPWL